MTEEIYPMPSFPVLTVRDLDVSSKWYQDVLGFVHIFTMPGPGGVPMLVHLRWMKYADLLLVISRDGQPVPEQCGAGVALNFTMFERPDPSVDSLSERAKGYGADVGPGPIDQPWNVRELTVHDPDGYKLVFTAPINMGLSFDQVIERAAGGK